MAEVDVVLTATSACEAPLILSMLRPTAAFPLASERLVIRLQLP